MNSKKTWILVILFLISQQLINAQLLVKESFKNQFTGEKYCKLINYEIIKEKENIIKTFEVDVIEQGDYYVYAWTMGNKKLKKVGVVIGMEKLNSFETKIYKLQLSNKIITKKMQLLK